LRLSYAHELSYAGNAFTRISLRSFRGNLVNLTLPYDL